MHSNLFQRHETAELMVKTLFHYRNAGEFQLHEYVIMPDHIHVLLTPKTDGTIERAAQLIKGGFSHQARSVGLTLNAIWQPRYHDCRIRDSNEYAEIARYIRENPVRKGLVTAAAEWPYSSAAKRASLDTAPQGLKPLTELNQSRDAGLKASSTKELDNVLS